MDTSLKTNMDTQNDGLEEVDFFGHVWYLPLISGVY